MRNRFWHEELNCENEIKVPKLLSGAEKHGELRHNKMRNRFWQGEFDFQHEITVPMLVSGTEKHGEFAIIK